MRQAALLVLLGCIAAAASGCGSDGPVISYQGYDGTAIVSRDGRTITVGGFGSCGSVDKAVARESAHKVALFVRTSTPRGIVPLCPNIVASLITAQQIRLRAPLGSRKLVDGRTARATPRISAELVLRPARLPREYHLAKLIPPKDEVLAQSADRAEWTQYYLPAHKASWLEIIQTAGKLPRSEMPPGGTHPIRVRGYPGHASRNVITWREDGLTDYIWMFGAQSPQGVQQLVTTHQLNAIAESAPGT
ncbi:MAG: hypothetical protein LBV34_23740 [Nocardiopsaceae bacterium]|jgi:hypothetical protein|nr:hypothetical protein [Nocardiopsaceae bacterium]